MYYLYFYSNFNTFKVKPMSSAEKSSKSRKSSEKHHHKVKPKKESPHSMKRKPVIAESDSDDEFIPPSKRPAPTNSVPTPIKQEPPPTPEKLPVTIAMKPDPSSFSSPPVGTPSRSLAGTKHKKEKKVFAPEGDADSDYDVKGGDDGDESYKEEEEEEFTTAKKKKKTTKSTATPKSKKPKANGTSSEKKLAKKSTPSSTKTATPKTSSATKVKKEPKTPKKEPAGATASPAKGGRGKKKEEEKEVWKWWEEEPHPDGIKWVTLEHKGPYFAPPYEPLPSCVRFYYDGKPMKLSERAEEAATFFGKMLDSDYCKKDIFCENFFADWRKEMTGEESVVIRDFKKCNFEEIFQYFKAKSEARKQMSKEEKKALKEENEKIVEEYGWALIDGHKEKIGNFKTEPPSLFRGRGDHPKQGRIKKRVQAEDVIINIGKAASVPTPPEGHKWRAVQHDQKVTWLASWTENIQGQIKYIMLNPTSRLKGEKDWAKYETARRLKSCVDKIREQYTQDLTSKEMRIRQRAVAMYFIDKLALRAGNEKDSDETADTVGCCSLRVEHIRLHEEMDGKKDVVEFDFLGKDSIRYYNRVPVDHQVFKNLRLFMKKKEGADDLFDRLNTSLLNKHLSELMTGLTAKVFRTFNASKTLQDQLDELTNTEDIVAEKMLSYNRANRAVAILCNHQRAVPKTFEQQMTNLQAKIEAKDEAILDTKKEIKQLKKEVKASSDSKLEKKLDTKKKQLARFEEQRKKLEVQATDKEENKEIALGTSKLNYLDPRITVAWCKKNEVPIEKVYNRSQRDKFAWAIDMADETFMF